MSVADELPGGSAAVDLLAAADLLEAAERQMSRAIKAARELGWAWTDIAEALDLNVHQARDLSRCLSQRIRRQNERAAS